MSHLSHCSLSIAISKRRYLYGFSKLEGETGAFSHPHFLRYDFNACHLVDRTNARIHVVSTISKERNESGDGRYMRSKLVKEARKWRFSTIDADDTETECNSSTRVVEYRTDCASPSLSDCDGHPVQFANCTVISPCSDAEYRPLSNMAFWKQSMQYESSSLTDLPDSLLDIETIDGGGVDVMDHLDFETIDDNVSMVETRDWLASMEINGMEPIAQALPHDEQTPTGKIHHVLPITILIPYSTPQCG